MQRRSSIIKCLLLIALSLLAFGEGLGSYFLSDDFVLIGSLSQDGYFLSWVQDEGGFLRPVTTASLMIDYHLWGFRSPGYHAMNLLLHAAASILLLFVARRLFMLWDLPEGEGAAFAAAALFAVLPSHSEAVYWISGRGDLLATATALAATLAFLTFMIRATVCGSWTRKWLMNSIAITFLAGALLAKESTVILPLIWLVIFLVHRRGHPGTEYRNATFLLVSTIPVLGGYMLLRKAILGSFVGGFGTARHLNLLNLNSVESALRYAARVMIPPIPLSNPDMSEAIIPLLLALMLAALAVLLLRAFIRRRVPGRTGVLLLLLVVLFLLSLLPVLSMKVSITETGSERYLYLPGVFACMLTGLALRLAFRSRTSFNAAATALATVSLIGLVQVERNWVTASKISEGISAQLSVYDPESVVVLNMPDNVRGAHLFRNGLSEAATIFQGRSADLAYQVISTHSIRSEEDEMVIGNSGDSLLVTLPATCEFISVDSSQCIVTGSTARCFTGTNLTVLYYSSGHLHVLDD